jgi:deazaflavin-dependent oxidoreductase (nitroreductase family)
MVMSKRVARLNRAVFNRFARPLAGWMPGLGVVHHRGRRSGRGYRTPVSVFAAPDGYVIALFYGSETDWVRNVLAAGNCQLRMRGRDVRLVAPRIVHDETRREVPAVVRPAVALLNVNEFLRLRAVPPEQHDR